MKKGFEKRFNQGDIIYFCENSQGQSKIRFARVDEQFLDAIYVDFLEYKENRYIDGIPLEEFRKNEYKQKYKKLPKGWSYNTELFKLEFINDPQDEIISKQINFNIKDPESIKKAYELGFLVKADDKFQGVIETDITKEGYKVITKYPMWEHKITHTTIRPDKCYFTYAEALKEKEEYEEEFKRQSELSDYEWSVEQIDKTLKRWQWFHDEQDYRVKEYRDWILGLDNVENIETRLSMGNIQWKYEDKKKWNNITL